MRLLVVDFVVRLLFLPLVGGLEVVDSVLEPCVMMCVLSSVLKVRVFLPLVVGFEVVDLVLGLCVMMCVLSSVLKVKLFLPFVLVLDVVDLQGLPPVTHTEMTEGFGISFSG